MALGILPWNHWVFGMYKVEQSPAELNSRGPICLGISSGSVFHGILGWKARRHFICWVFHDKMPRMCQGWFSTIETSPNHRENTMSAIAYFNRQRAQQLAKQCGTWSAARFLAKRDVSLEDALTIFGFPIR